VVQSRLLKSSVKPIMHVIILSQRHAINRSRLLPPLCPLFFKIGFKFKLVPQYQSPPPKKIMQSHSSKRRNDDQAKNIRDREGKRRKTRHDEADDILTLQRTKNLQPRPLDRARDRARDRPSDHWPTAASNAAPLSKKVEEIISKGNWTFLCAEAAKQHRSSFMSGNAIKCTVNLSKYTLGTYNAVFELSFSDHTFWVARIRLWGDADCETEMLSEIATMRMVNARTSIPVPTVFTYNCDANNLFGYPYMLMGALPGKHLDDQFAFSVPTSFQPKIAAQLAKYVWELSQITFDGSGRIWCGYELDEEPQVISFPVLEGEIGPFNSSRAYFFGIRQEINRAVHDQHLNDEDWPQWLASCEVLTRAIPLMISPQFRRGPFPLYHRDFHYNNILVDDDFNITGALDWSGARTVPVERFAAYADLMTYPLLSEEENRPIVEFRSLFISAYRQLEAASKASFSLSDVFDSTLPEVIYRWDAGVPRNARLARRNALWVLHLLYGSDTTFDNYKVRQRKQGKIGRHKLRVSKGL